MIVLARVVACVDIAGPLGEESRRQGRSVPGHYRAEPEGEETDGEEETQVEGTRHSCLLSVGLGTRNEKKQMRMCGALYTTREA